MKPLSDYSHIRGFNYTASYAGNDEVFWDDYRHEVVEREMGYAQRLGLNSARVFLPFASYKKAPERFFSNISDFVRTAYQYGVSTSPIVFFGRCFYPDFEDDKVDMLAEENWDLSEAYFDELYAAIGQEPGLLFWDISNEPGYHTPNFVTFYPEEPDFRKALAKEPEDMEGFRAKQEQVWKFIRHCCRYVRKKDPVNAIGIGNTYAYEIEPSQTAELVDILIFHDYFETRKRVRDTCNLMKALSEKYGKPVINNETGCLCRANPYDMELAIMQEYGFGWYVFELMIGSDMWNRVHGIVYPDGTIRDPAIVAAVQGFFRNRSEGAICSDVNRENNISLAIKLANHALAATANPAIPGDCAQLAEQLLEAAEYVANFLEAGELVPMRIPPTARIAAYRRMKNPNVDEIKDWLYELVCTIKKACHILDETERFNRV